MKHQKVWSVFIPLVLYLIAFGICMTSNSLEGITKAGFAALAFLIISAKEALDK